MGLVAIGASAPAAPFFGEVDRRDESATYVIWVEAGDLQAVDEPEGRVYRMESATLQGAPGAPLLPRLTRLVEVPPGRRAVLHVRAASTRLLEGWEEPRQARDSSGLPLLPADRRPIRLGPVAERGARRVAALRVDPLRVTERGLELLSIARIQIDFPEAELTGELKVVERSPWPAADAPGYVVLAADHLAAGAALEELAEWRTRRGFNVSITPVSQVGAEPFAIKDWIAYHYERGATHVLFAGDDPSIPVFPGGRDPSEHWYTTVGGYDLYSDVALGRFCAETEGELAEQIAATMRWERAGGPNLDTVLMVAHKAGYPGRYTALSDGIVQAHQNQALSFVPIYGGAGAVNADVQAALALGAGLINYRGYGGPDDWQTWGADDQDFAVGDVVPGARMVFNVSCDNGWIDDDEATSLGEAWMDRGQAVGVLGSLRRSYTVPNDALDEELFRLILDQGVVRAGALLNRAREFLIDTQGQYGSHNARIYLWLGDPDAPILTAPLTSIDAAMPSHLSLEEEQFEVGVEAEGEPVAGAVVTLSRGRLLLARAETDDLGRATLDLPSGIGAGPALIAVTGDRLLPLEESIALAAPGGDTRHVEPTSARPRVD